MAEMTTFSVGNRNVNLWDLYVTAAKFMYGEDIELLKSPAVIQGLNDIAFTIRVEATDPNVVEKTRTTVDISTKEYTNRSEKEVDETLIRVHKNFSRENQYHFTPTHGVSWGFGGDIGAKVMGLSMSGGTAVVGGMYSDYYQSRSKESSNTDFNFSYQQEEKIQVPPMSRVKVRVTSHAIKYEQGYTLRFSIPATYLIQVHYKTSCNQMCYGSQAGHITAGLMFQPLPSYQEQDGVIHFFQQGILSWMGEGRQVDKTTEHIGSRDLLQ